MEITEFEELKTFEPVDKEPFHYFALVKSTSTPSWSTTYQHPMTDKQALINTLNNSYMNTYYDEARIYKVRLPIG